MLESLINPQKVLGNRWLNLRGHLVWSEFTTPTYPRGLKLFWGNLNRLMGCSSRQPWYRFNLLSQLMLRMGIASHYCNLLLNPTGSLTVQQEIAKNWINSRLSNDFLSWSQWGLIGNSATLHSTQLTVSASGMNLQLVRDWIYSVKWR